MADEEQSQRWYERKSALMEEALGKEHDMVMHAIIPYAIGGGLDLYYYPNDIPGTAVATKELSDLPGEGSTNAVFDCYELVMFTRHPIDLDAAKDEATPFGRAHGHQRRPEPDRPVQRAGHAQPERDVRVPRRHAARRRPVPDLRRLPVVPD